jgi:hypothetical protein
MVMTPKLNNDNGLQDWRTEHQAVTGVWQKCGFSARPYRTGAFGRG